MTKQLKTPEIAVISDIHLGTHACKAKELLSYLKSIKPEQLILNGDIFDAWRFSRNYFPKPHLKVVRRFIKMMEQGTKIVYITGNHDEFLRKFENISLGNLQIVNQITLKTGDTKTWIFHGDVFDNVIHNAKWMAKSGAALYGFLNIINNIINAVLQAFTGKEIILYKSLKTPFLKEKNKASAFEKKVAQIAVNKRAETVICGHSHIPKDKVIQIGDKKIRYINSGDWVENFTAVEFKNNYWELVTQKETILSEFENDDNQNFSQSEIYFHLFNELTFSN